ncbi:uncharacterized protein METZ01_LOCUS384822, partial [marine metagenome]
FAGGVGEVGSGVAERVGLLEQPAETKMVIASATTAWIAFIMNSYRIYNFPRSLPHDRTRRS